MRRLALNVERSAVPAALAGMKGGGLDFRAETGTAADPQARGVTNMEIIPASAPVCPHKRVELKAHGWTITKRGDPAASYALFRRCACGVMAGVTRFGLSLGSRRRLLSRSQWVGMTLT